MACDRCGFQNEPNERFCGGCGAAIAAQPGSVTDKPKTSSPPIKIAYHTAESKRGDRRPVTVMFVDLSGYTALSATLDPEDTNRLLQQYFDLVDGLVVDFGGTIDRHIGDGVMALFGAPISHGNDPERAIRAAAAIQAAMPSLASDFVHAMTVHIGLALGEVVARELGSAAHTSYRVTGNAPNLAARLMESAGPGETLVAEELARATQHIAAFEASGLAQLKGLAVPKATFRLLGLRADQFEEPAMVGRQSDLTRLLSVVTAAQTSGKGGWAAIRGVPGIGKSRLLREVKARANAMGLMCVSGLVLDFGAHAGEDVIAAITAGLLGTSPDASAQIKIKAIADSFTSARIKPDDQPFILDLLSLSQPAESQTVYAAMDARARRRGMAAALIGLLQTASRDRAVLIAVEDVHWANKATLGLLAQLAAAADHCTAVLIMTTRIDGDPFDADWRAQSSGGPAVTIDLRPLAPEDAVQLVTGILSEVDDFATQCVVRAEGNPLFLEQLLRSKLQDGDAKLPHSIQGVVLARLDSLAEPDRHALRAASVLGQRFVPGDLQALLGTAAYDLATLTQRQLLKHEGDGLLFAHALIRDGVYASLTRDTRRDLHRRAAAFYADHDAVLHAEHLDKAEDPEAAHAYLCAAESEATAFRQESAVMMAMRGLQLATQEDDIAKLGLAVGRLRLTTGETRLAREAFERIVLAATDDADRCRGLIGLAAADRILTDLDQAAVSLDAAQIIATALGSAVMLSEIHYMRGNLHFARSDSDACLKEHMLALEAAEAANVPEWKARALSGLGDAAYLQVRIKTALQHFQACLELAERHHLLRVIPANQCMIGNCMCFLLKFGQALDQCSAAHAAAKRVGDRFAEMFALQGTSVILFLSGRLPEAEAPVEAALNLATQLGARRFEPYFLAVLAKIRLTQGQKEAARDLLDAAWLLAGDSDLNFFVPLVSAVYADLCGATEEGRAWIATGERDLAQTPHAHNQIMFRAQAMDWAIRAQDWQMVERFAAELEALTAVEPLPYVDFIASRSRALVALRRNPNDREAAETMNRLKGMAAALNLRLAS